MFYPPTPDRSGALLQHVPMPRCYQGMAWRSAGQGIVQFAEGAENSCAYAVKFFLDAEAFRTETALYAACTSAPLDSHRSLSAGVAGSGALALLHDSAPSHLATPAEDESAEPADVEGSLPLAAVRARGRFLPLVEAVCGGGEGLVDPRGRPLPPCIVMEKGESLYDWSERAEPDLFTALAVRFRSVGASLSSLEKAPSVMQLCTAAVLLGEWHWDSVLNAVLMAS